MPWHPGRTLLALVMTLAGGLLAGGLLADGAALAQGTAYAQGPVLRPPALSPVHPAPVNPPVGPQPSVGPRPSATWHAPQLLPDADVPPAGLPAAAPCEREFWIVSTRNCRQASCPQCAGGDLGYFHVADGQEPRRSSADAFRAGLVPGVPVCVVVHGSAVSWDGLLKAAPRIVDWIRAAAPGPPVQFVFFSWPSEDVTLIVAPIDLGIRGMQASFNGLYLARFVQTLPPDTPISIVGHSHGTRVAAAALHLLDGGTVNRLRLAAADVPTRRIRVAFLAAAIDRHWLAPGERYGRAMNRTERLLNVVNRDDFALALYPFRKPFSNTALGYTGIGRIGFARLGEAAMRYSEYDVTSLLRRGHDWHVYYKKPHVARVVAPLVTFADSLPPSQADGFHGPEPAGSMGTQPAMNSMNSMNSMWDASTFEPWLGLERF